MALEVRLDRERARYEERIDHDGRRVYLERFLPTLRLGHTSATLARLDVY